MSGILTPNPLQYIRQFDSSPYTDMVFESTSDRIDFLSNIRRYAGMICSDLELDGDCFVLNAAKTAWRPIGSGAVQASIIDIYQTYSQIPNDITTPKFVYVIVDETNYNDHTLYLHTGTELKFLQTVA